jgi:hypothetical protein
MRSSDLRDITAVLSGDIQARKQDSLRNHRCENLKFYVDIPKSRKYEIRKETAYELP